jgi:hypothetical protein
MLTIFQLFTHIIPYAKIKKIFYIIYKSLHLCIFLFTLASSLIYSEFKLSRCGSLLKFLQIVHLAGFCFLQPKQPVVKLISIINFLHNYMNFKVLAYQLRGFQMIGS